MSRKSGTQTQTTTSEPPGYLRPYLERGAQESMGLYNSGGTPVVGFDPATQQALSLTERMALNGGGPVGQSATNLATNTLQGGFLGQNPYLDQMFNRAAGAVTNQVQSNFGRAGRNVGGADAAGVAADRYSNLAADIYGGAYENERARQQQTLALSPGLVGQQYQNLGQLANVGAQREALQREIVGQPGRNLDELLARLQGFPGGTVTQQIPMQRNVLGGALGGAGVGYQAFGNPWGALGGALLGGLLG